MRGISTVPVAELDTLVVVFTTTGPGAVVIEIKLDEVLLFKDLLEEVETCAPEVSDSELLPWLSRMLLHVVLTELELGYTVAVAVTVFTEAEEVLWSAVTVIFAYTVAVTVLWEAEGVGLFVKTVVFT